MSDLSKLAKYGIYLGLFLYVLGMLFSILHLPYVEETQVLAIVIVSIFYCFNLIVLEEKGWSDYLGLFSISILLLKLFPDQLSSYSYSMIEKFYHPSFIFLFIVVFGIKWMEPSEKSEAEKFKRWTKEQSPQMGFSTSSSTNYLSNFQYAFAAIAVIGLLFKMMYWNYASILIIIGFLGYAILMLIGGLLKK